MSSKKFYFFVFCSILAGVILSITGGLCLLEVDLSASRTGAASTEQAPPETQTSRDVPASLKMARPQKTREEMAADSSSRLADL